MRINVQAFSKPVVFHGTVTKHDDEAVLLAGAGPPDETLWECAHAHPTTEEATACAQDWLNQKFRAATGEAGLGQRAEGAIARRDPTR